MRRSVSQPRRAWAWRGIVRCRNSPEAKRRVRCFPAAGFCRHRRRCLGSRRDGFRRRSFLATSGLSAYPNFTDVVRTHLFFAALACKISGCPLFSGMASRPPGSLEEKGFGDHGFHVHRVKTRRRMLGLSQADLGVILGLLVPKDPSDPKPVGQQTVSRWEEGVNGHGEPPYWVQDALPGILDRIGQV